jgi:IclR family transcriptional regulator, acetate operon repressor
MNEQSPRPRNTINAVKRALDVLLLFTTSGSAYLGVSEIAGQLRISKAVVYRMLSTLRAAGLVELDESTRRYSLGPTTLAIADAYLAHIDIRDLAQAPMRRLSDLTDETATLSILTGRSRVYIGQEAPARELKMTVPLGHPFPLHAGSSSKAFLAFLSEADREKYLAAGELPALTERTVTNQEALRRELAAVRGRGYAVSFGERQQGAGSVAAPIFNRQGEPVAVMSVCGPAERFRESAGRVAALLLTETSALSRRLGYLSSPSRDPADLRFTPTQVRGTEG